MPNKLSDFPGSGVFLFSLLFTIHGRRRGSPRDAFATFASPGVKVFQGQASPCLSAHNTHTGTTNKSAFYWALYVLFRTICAKASCVIVLNKLLVIIQLFVLLVDKNTAINN